MFNNYIKVAFRNLVRNRLYSLINIFGLATGFASCILIMLFVRQELSYDEFWTNADTISRVNTTVSLAGRPPYVSVSASAPMKEAVESFFPNDIIRVTRFIPMHPTVTLNGEAFAEDMHWTDPETAQMFDLTVLKGDMDTTLNDKSSLAVSETFAEKYFGRDDPIGRTLKISLFEIERDYKIGAVFKNLPENTSLSLNALAKFDLADFPMTKGYYDTWGNLGEHLVYVQLKRPEDFHNINDRLPDLIDTHVVGLNSLKSGPDSKVSDFYKQTLQRLEDIHLNPTGMGEMKPSGSMETVRILGVISGLVLLIACINFVNLVTAKSTQRAREVALRKVLGASRRQLILQFLGETVFLASAGLIFGLIMVEMILPLFNGILNAELVLSYNDGMTLISLISLVILTGLVAGLYPAFILSGFMPARILQANNSARASRTFILRNSLVILQFTISITLIVATATVYGQTWYATNKDPGYSKDNLIVLNGINNKAIAAQKEALKQTVLKIQGINAAGFTEYSPIDVHERLGSFQLEGATADKAVMISRQAVDYDFLDTFKISLRAGRFYSRDHLTDGMPNVNADVAVGTVIINEESVRRLGMGTPEAAIGKYVTTTIGMNAEGPVMGKLEIIGVTSDIFFQSPKKAIRAEVYVLMPQLYNTLAIQFNGDPRAIITRLENVWKSFTNAVPFQYEVVEDTIVSEFRKELNLSVVLAAFSAITVLVACMGLYGLAAFTAQSRTKEIGIRKVLGAGVFDIVRLMVWQFSKLVIMANFIAWPIAGWIMMQWLETFPYRLDTWLLLFFCFGAGLLSLIIAWTTVSTQAVRVARANPILALRYE